MISRPTSYGSGGFAPRPQPPVSLVIFTAVDAALGAARDWTIRARPVVDLLASSRIPAVFISSASADRVMALQRTLGVYHPFVAEDGAAVFVPQGYFAGLLESVVPDRPWETITLRARAGTGPAVQLLMSLYRLREDATLFVGLAEAWKDRALLRAVDVPVIVRNHGVDQDRLVRVNPTAYVTSAAGPAGWSEAILGSLAV